MNRERLHRLVDMVLDVPDGDLTFRTSITIDNAGDHQISIYFHVGQPGNKSDCYVSNFKRFHYSEDFISDPTFAKAEKGLMKAKQEALKYEEGKRLKKRDKTDDVCGSSKETDGEPKNVRTCSVVRAAQTVQHKQKERGGNLI